jgi:hypothetical protein
MLLRRVALDQEPVVKGTGLRHEPTRRSVREDLSHTATGREQRMDITGHGTDTQHARYTHLLTKTLRGAINKLSPIPE